MTGPTDAQRDAYVAIAQQARSIFSIDHEDDGSILIAWTDKQGRDRQSQILRDGTVL